MLGTVPYWKLAELLMFEVDVKNVRDEQRKQTTNE